MTYGSVLVAVIAGITGDPTPEIRAVLKDQFESLGRSESLAEDLADADAARALNELRHDPSQLLRIYTDGKKTRVH